MKIYTITCNNAYNYGAVLQAFALQRYLEKLGNDVEIIDYYPPYLRKISSKYRNNPIAILARKILYAPDYKKSKQTFSEFKMEYLKETSERYYSLDELRNLPVADLYIAGSDQIWNPYMENGCDENYYLEFAKGRKIAYAASIGCVSIEDKYISYYKKKLNGFDTITVRERDTNEYLKKIGIQADYVVDPVFLLERDEWKRLCTVENNERYVIVYALHHIQEIYDYAKKLARCLGVKMYVISVEIKERKRGYDKFFWNPSVNQFLTLLLNADAVVTNSFHGASFGVIFKKPLHIFDTENNDNRLKNLVELFGLQTRVISIKYKDLIDNIVEDHTEKLMEAEIRRSKRIIANILEGERNV